MGNTQTTFGVEAKREFATEQFEELRQRGFSRKQAGAIMRITGPRLAVPCVEWVASIWDKSTKVLDKEADLTRDELVGWCETFGEKDFIVPNAAIAEGADWAVAIFQVIDLANDLLGRLDGETEPLKPVNRGRRGRDAFPSTSKMESKRILNGAIEAARYFPEARARIAATRV